MLYVTVEILRFVDDHMPGFVECRLIDVLGESHTFIEKISVVTTAYLDSASHFPQPGSLGCEMITMGQDEQGHELREITTEQPWNIESTLGKSKFVVLADQLSEE